jgi:hypothetical protein
MGQSRWGQTIGKKASSKQSGGKIVEFEVLAAEESVVKKPGL